MHTIKHGLQHIVNHCQTNDEPRAKLERYLTELGISFTTLIHPAVFTVSELMEHVICMPGLHAKNLFVKDKKSGSLYLITVRHDVPVQLNVVAKLVKAKELRFADPDVLLAVLGVPQGSVTPFALMNDADHVVTFVLDEQLWNDDSKIVNFHPLINTSTTGITVAGFKVFLDASGHKPVIIQL